MCCEFELQKDDELNWKLCLHVLLELQ
uniref:Uncharacterized protein n=1 Tax=Anguilla anguilla TaxID=7936 RepID=A0A0E9VKZ2_ANGAN